MGRLPMKVITGGDRLSDEHALECPYKSRALTALLQCPHCLSKFFAVAKSLEHVKGVKKCSECGKEYKWQLRARVFCTEVGCAGCDVFATWYLEREG